MIRISIGSFLFVVAGEVADWSLEVVAVVAAVSLHTMSVPHHVTRVHVHVVHVPVVHVVHVPVGARVHGPVVTIGVTITIVAVVGISISFSSGFRGCKGSKADLEMSR